MSFIRKLLVTYFTMGSTLDILPTLTTKSVLKSITLQRYFNETCSPWPYSWPLLIQDKINLITWRKIIIALCDCFFFLRCCKVGTKKNGLFVLLSDISWVTLSLSDIATWLLFQYNCVRYQRIIYPFKLCLSGDLNQLYIIIR